MAGYGEAREQLVCAPFGGEHLISTFVNMSYDQKYESVMGLHNRKVPIAQYSDIEGNCLNNFSIPSGFAFSS
jgi:hypothetical protein